MEKNELPTKQMRRPRRPRRPKHSKRSKQSNHSKRSKQIHQQAHARLHVQIGRCMPKRKASNASIVSTASGASKYALGRSV